MKVFIANFGKGNYAWERCKQGSTIATMNDADLSPLWVAGDREAYIAGAVKNRKTAGGDIVPRPLASRWFNLMTIISESVGDIWIHSDGDYLWWTETNDQPARIDVDPITVPYQSMKVFECHKPCRDWSNRDHLGSLLSWNSLHPKAKEFLSTESTLQQLSAGNAEYARALISGAKLDGWHLRKEWQAKSANSKTGQVRNYNFVERSVVDMAFQAEQTAKNANGQIIERVVRSKDFQFASRQELERYLYSLLEAQDGRCAISGINLQFKGAHDDEQLLCSLDRIDSSKHYERDNLQIVCRFINFWKNNMDDGEFRRLLRLIIQEGNVIE